MKAQDRIDALEAGIAEIEAEIATLEKQHEDQVQKGYAQKADHTYEQIKGARERLEASAMQRGPLQRALDAEKATTQAKLAEELTRDADDHLAALEAKIAEVVEASAKLAAICDDLDQNAGLHWASAARKAVEAGGSPARRPLKGIDDLLENVTRSRNKMTFVANEYMQRGMAVPAATKSHAA